MNFFHIPLSKGRMQELILAIFVGQKLAQQDQKARSVRKDQCKTSATLAALRQEGRQSQPHRQRPGQRDKLFPSAAIPSQASSPHFRGLASL
jgi:hypothetical protein